jgi:hypothetical protein
MFANARLLSQLALLIGVKSALKILADSLRPASTFWWYDVLTERVKNKPALEIGGPSEIFARRIPIYPLLERCDIVDFSPSTIWNKSSESTPSSSVRPPAAGRKYLAEATALAEAIGMRYGVVLSSHVLEHIANPIRALKEWRHMLTGSGTIIVVVPEGGRTFDHLRPTTTLIHFDCDERNDVGEDDSTHFDEVLRLHDLRMDRGAGSREDFERRCAANLMFRALHHHVFSAGSLEGLLRRAGLNPVAIARVVPSNLLAICD